MPTQQLGRRDRVMDTYTGYLNVELKPTPILGECVFPRIITGTLTPRLDRGVIFYRVRCIIDKWVS